MIIGQINKLFLHTLEFWAWEFWLGGIVHLLTSKMSWVRPTNALQPEVAQEVGWLLSSLGILGSLLYP